MSKNKNNKITLEPLPITKILFLALLKKYPNSSGYDLMQKVNELSKNRVQIKSGSIYPTLRELEKMDFAKSTQLTTGRKRRLYTLTEKGRTELTLLIEGIKDRMNFLLYPIFKLIEDD